MYIYVYLHIYLYIYIPVCSVTLKEYFKFYNLSAIGFSEDTFVFKEGKFFFALLMVSSCNMEFWFSIKFVQNQITESHEKRFL